MAEKFDVGLEANIHFWFLVHMDHIIIATVAQSFTSLQIMPGGGTHVYSWGLQGGAAPMGSFFMREPWTLVCFSD